MLIVLSPTKNQNFHPESLTSLTSTPHFQKEANELVRIIRRLKPEDLGKLLMINHSLTQLNFDRYIKWQTVDQATIAKHAILAFDGEAFRGLNAKTFSENEFIYAQQHLRILSGLYGVLRPLDLIQPYRLEVSSKLKNKQGDDLYPFWLKKATRLIKEEMASAGETPFLLNLASSEYLKMLDLKKLRCPVISPEFYEYRPEGMKQVVIYTKKARGMMARFVITNRIDQIEALQAFNEDGYWFHPELSTFEKPVFVR